MQFDYERLNFSELSFFIPGFYPQKAAFEDDMTGRKGKFLKYIQECGVAPDSPNYNQELQEQIDLNRQAANIAISSVGGGNWVTGSTTKLLGNNPIFKKTRINTDLPGGQVELAEIQRKYDVQYLSVDEVTSELNFFKYGEVLSLFEDSVVKIIRGIDYFKDGELGELKATVEADMFLFLSSNTANVLVGIDNIPSQMILTNDGYLIDEITALWSKSNCISPRNPFVGYFTR